MKEITGNLWDVPCDWRGITTNGFVKANGECVMGRGCALEASNRFPKLPFQLGQFIKLEGNVVFSFPSYGVFTFPVKKHWKLNADLELIRYSTLQLKGWAQDADDQTFVLPRPGCGNGRLRWADVKPLLIDLPDNVSIITF